MNKQQAQKIIKDTFERSFDMNRFTVFMKNLLNRIDESKAFHAHGYVKEGFRGIIKTYERVGTYNATDDKKVDIIVVYLQKGFSLDHARVTQRNFAGRYLDDRGEKDAGLFAFVSPDETDWRFSLVKMDYKFEHAKTGRMKVKEEFTPARRWSFLVGENEKSHTAQSRLVQILADDEHDPTLKDIEKAFDIETVTKEFFLKYRELFLRTKEELDRVVKEDPKVEADFEANGVDTVNFAKKLLGQIIFLYFLQKKGWFGVGRDDDWGTGSKHFLRELFEKKHSDYNNFFNDILEPLFYEALRSGKDREHIDYYYSRFNCKIPFLNGGLFDPIGNYDWVHTDIIIPDKLFSNSEKTKEGDTGTGILDVFDRYNFTVKEDEPLEKEVAIDPELLGKAYEKFNAIRPDNYDEFRKALKSGKTGEENKFNKKFGVYYTPREIVHYMCQQSLINYLSACLAQAGLATELSSVIPSDLPAEASAQAGARNPKEDIEALIHTGEHVSENEARVISEGRETKTYSHQLPESIRKNAKLIDDKLAEITVCDPAVGSGAFPVGMMSEIVKTRNVLTPFLSLRGAQATKQSQFDDNRIVYNFKRQCIEHSLYGVDIDPGAVEIAKLRLWLSLVVDEEDIKNIKPLPNLDYRIMQGNSLIELLSTESLVGTMDHKRTGLVKELKISKDELFNITIPTQKENKRREIDILMKKLFEYDRDSQIKRLQDDILAVKSQQRLFEDDKNKKEDEKKIREIKSRIEKIKNIDIPGPTEHFEWNVNYSEIFQEKGGFDVVIANPPYVQLQDKSKITTIELNKYKSQNFETFEASADIYCLFYEKGSCVLKKDGFLIFITSNRFCFTNYGKSARQYLCKKNLHEIININEIEVFEEANVGTVILSLSNSKITNDHITIMDYKSNNSISNFEKIINDNVELVERKHFTKKQWSFYSNSILNIKHKLEDNSIPFKDIKDLKINRGLTTGLNHVFIIDDILSNMLIKEDHSAKEIIKPVLRGANVKRWAIKPTNNYLIYTYAGIDIQKYPSVFNYLRQHEEELRNVYEARKGQKKWYELRKCKYYNSFNLNKIIWTRLSNINSFAISNNKEFSVDSTSFAVGKNLEYYCAILNSKITFFYFKLGGVIWGKNGIKWFGDFFDNIPMPNIPESKQKPFIEIVDTILPISQSDDYLQSSQKQTEVKALEAEIDQLVYQLYGLTPEEIEVVENSNKK